jgi:hypothetical protein
METERISETDSSTKLAWIVTCEMLLLLAAVKASSITLVFFFAPLHAFAVKCVCTNFILPRTD